MLKAPLETSLEKICLDNGGALSDREYLEDVKLAAEIDKIDTPPNAKNPVERLMWALTKNSDYYFLAWNENMFFCRKGIVKKFEVEYNLWDRDDSELGEVKPIIDRIIAGKEYSLETLSINKKHSIVLLQLSVSNVGKVIIDRIEKTHPLSRPYSAGLAKVYAALHNKKIGADEICKKLIEFIESHQYL